MSLFRVDPDNPFEGPHQIQHTAKAGADPGEAKAAMVLVHGRGATAESILMLADEFNRDDFHYRAPQADRYTWYPYSFLAPVEQNEPGISSGQQAVHDVITAIEGAGITKEKIILLGFSQGACLTLEYAARHPQRFGGIVGFSGGLIGQSVDASLYEGSLEQTPVFLGCSDRDPHIPEERVRETAGVMEKLGGEVTTKIYPGMGHTVNENEIEFVRNLMASLS